MKRFLSPSVVLYVFFAAVTIVLFMYAYSRLTNPFFGTRITNAPAWFEIGSQYFRVSLAIAGTFASLVSMWGLAQNKRWVRGLSGAIAWFVLVFYFGNSLLLFTTNAMLSSKSHLPFFVVFDAKTLLLTVLSVPRWLPYAQGSSAIRMHSPAGP